MMMGRIAPWLVLGITMISWVRPAFAAEFPSFRAQEIDPRVGNVCYALAVSDVNGDRQRDVVAVTENAVVWFENPTWRKHTIIENATERDNVCLQPRDIDGDGRIDFALGAAWRPADTQGGGTLQWLTRTGATDKDKTGWRVLPLGNEPTLHRLRWGDVLGKGSGQAQLIVAPLQGRGTKGPNWGEGQGVRILVHSVPSDPFSTPWPVEVAEDTLHTVHNLHLLNFDDDPQDEIVLSAWEGVFLLDRGKDGRWTRTKLGVGNQDAKPFKGASEVKVGALSGGRKRIATIEPWHGFQVVVYAPPSSGQGLWSRHVIDEGVTWGHAVWWANLDADPDDELIIGQRDPSNVAGRTPRGPGVLVYDPTPDDAQGVTFTRHVIDDGGVAVEDLLADDLDGDGDPDLIAGGRATHNVKIYWNSHQSQSR